MVTVHKTEIHYCNQDTHINTVRWSFELSQFSLQLCVCVFSSAVLYNLEAHTSTTTVKILQFHHHKDPSYCPFISKPTSFPSNLIYPSAHLFLTLKREGKTFMQRVKPGPMKTMNKKIELGPNQEIFCSPGYPSIYCEGFQNCYEPATLMCLPCFSFLNRMVYCACS